jgi:hypothetical protein
MGNSTGKGGRIFQKYRVTNVREDEQLIATMKQKVQAKAQRIGRYIKKKGGNPVCLE